MASGWRRMVVPPGAKMDLGDTEREWQRDDYLDGMWNNRHRIDPGVIPQMKSILNILENKDGFLRAVSDLMEESLSCTSWTTLDGGSGNNDIRKGVDFWSETLSLKRQFHLLAECMGFVQEETERRLNSALLRIGVASLPDEILSHILAFASHHESTSDDLSTFGKEKQFFSTVSLSHVCRRFRRVVLSTPQFWTSVSDSMQPSLVEVCLARSGAMPLDIFLDSFGNIQVYSEFHGGEFSNVLVRSSPRWKNLTIRAAPFDAEMHLPPLEIMNAPQLRILSIRSLLKFPMDPNDPQSQISICHKWTIPRLQSLNIYQFIPPPFQHATSLTNLHIELGLQTSFRRLGEGWVLDIDALGQFLKSFPTLREDCDTVHPIVQVIHVISPAGKYPFPGSLNFGCVVRLWGQRRRFAQQ
ncbi:hypothetical protein SCHPADRAFT_97325 [Schizopora paradoxa]|uniref:F-box domain-containing protein n=1 Tax=Schizopora paradoxa TaxID=27342 RepID=A0A0H2S4Y9_9AGAM|nr:hypothetical protein SCHPADRAFT_97325 [Schizopora paradoxa]